MESVQDCYILIIEGTRLTGANIFDSENIVRDSCLRAVDMVKGLVIADFSSRNLEYLELFILVSTIAILYDYKKMQQYHPNKIL